MSMSNLQMPTSAPMTANLGVNIAGYVNGEFGLGEGVRANIRSIEAAGIPFVINNFDLSFHRKLDQTYQNFTSNNPYPINLIQINADEVKTFINQVGPSYLKQKYNIGFWAWELSKFPPESHYAFQFFDEIWTYSNHCAEAISLAAPIPVLKITPSINLAIPSSSKNQLKFPENKFIFLSIFDFASSIQRKNILGTIQAFKNAFGENNPDILLVIKSANSNRFNKAKALVNSQILNHPSIVHIDGYLSREEINGLLYHCHCYISLHRAEGFGLTMAEAMFYGKPVIATGYSSNIEFMNNWNSFLVPYKLIEIETDSYHYKKGNIWADPDLENAAYFMREIHANYAQAQLVGTRAAQDIQTLFNPSIVGAKIKDRLETIARITDNFTRYYPNPKITHNSINPLVSICIPTYNGSAFIGEALTSALNQTYPNVEIIISDDGSTDNTIGICQAFQAETSHDLRISLHKNYGLAGNWNFCISQAKGKYIKFLFQDDKLAPNCIEEMVKLAEKDAEIGLVFAPRKLILGPGAEDNETCMLAYQAIRELHKRWTKLQEIQPGKDLLNDPLLWENPINKIGEPSNILIKKSVFDAIDLFDGNLRQYLDLEMWFRIMGYYKIGFIDQELSEFRIHPDQQTWRNYFSGIGRQDLDKMYGKMLAHPIYSFLPLAIKEQLQQKLGKVAQNEGEDIRNIVNKYSQHPSNKLLHILQQKRDKFAKLIIATSAEKLIDNYQGNFRNTYQALAQSGLMYEALTEGEQVFLKEIINKFAELQNSANSIPYLLALTLYLPAYNLQLGYHNVSISRNLLEDFLQFILAVPVYFPYLGDLDKYSQYFDNIVNYTAQSILNNPGVEIWDDVAKFMVNKSPYLPLYLAHGVMKNVATNWSGILADYIKLQNIPVIDVRPTLAHQNKTKIRVGILVESDKLERENLAIVPWEYLNKNQFEVIVYNHTLLSGELAQQIATIQSDNLDILIIGNNPLFRDITVDPPTSNQFSLLCHHRLAKIQLTTSSITPVTTGVKNIDYYIAGNLIISDNTQQDYSEKIITIKGSGLCFASQANQPPTVHPTRASWGATEQSIVFISGANFSKITPELRVTWIKILLAIPGSILVLHPFYSSIHPAKIPFLNQIRAQLTAHHIDKKRLVVLNYLGGHENLRECLKIADIYLDSFPYTGATSLINPLNVGLPLVVWEGESIREKQAGAMLKELQITNLVTHSEQDYIELAVKLAINPDLRQFYRQQIQQKMGANPPFLDGRGYAHQVADVWQMLLQNNQ